MLYDRPSRVPWPPILLIGAIAIALTLASGNYVLRYVRWQYYLQTLGHHVATWPSLQYFIAGFAFMARDKSLVPERDPFLGESLAFKNF